MIMNNNYNLLMSTSLKFYIPFVLFTISNIILKFITTKKIKNPCISFSLMLIVRTC